MAAAVSGLMLVGEDSRGGVQIDHRPQRDLLQIRCLESEAS
jgi:hypothetical protein